MTLARPHDHIWKIVSVKDENIQPNGEKDRRYIWECRKCKFHNTEIRHFGRYA